jgi:hypothetical protein
MFLTAALALLKFLGGGNVKAVIDGVTEVSKNKTNVEGQKHLSDNEAGQALAAKYFDSVDKANEAKARNRPIYLVVFGLIAFATPCGIVVWAASLDSLPFYIPFIMDKAHVVGSWGIDIPPKLQVPFEKIIDSFFISAPVAAVGMGLVHAFRRK